MYEWALSVWCKSQRSVPWDGLGESGLPSPQHKPPEHRGDGSTPWWVVTSWWASAVCRGITSQRLGQKHTPCRHLFQNMRGHMRISRTSVYNYPNIPLWASCWVQEARDLSKMNWKTRGISFSWKGLSTFHHCHKDVSNLRHLPFGIHISFSVKDLGWD